MMFLRILNRLFYLLAGFFYCVVYFGVYTPSLRQDTAGIALFSAIGTFFLVMALADDILGGEQR